MTKACIRCEKRCPGCRKTCIEYVVSEIVQQPEKERMEKREKKETYDRVRPEAADKAHGNRTHCGKFADKMQKEVIE